MEKIQYLRAIIIIVLLCFFTNASAQLSTNEKPVSYGIETKLRVKRRSAIPFVTMPTLDMAKIEEESKVDGDNDMPLRFGYCHKVHYTPNNSGTWYELPDGDRLWQLEVICPEALSVCFSYDKFWLPEGGKLFVYSKDRKQSIGAFTSRNNKGDREQPRGFATELIHGSDVVLEYYQPSGGTSDAIISIAGIVHGYRQIPLWENDLFKVSGSCMVNINCEEGRRWQNEKNAVACMITITDNGNFNFSVSSCSGSLINTTDLSEKPFFLTANHCIRNLGKDAIEDSILDNTIFYWNYEAAGCDSDSTLSTYYTTNGATVLSNNPITDFALLRLTEDPKDLPNYTPYYLGWDISGESGDPGVCIHHPMGDIKKISTVDSLPQSTYWNNQIQFPNSHWKVNWKETPNGYSTTQKGSSGSPLLNAFHRVIGQLHGGPDFVCVPNVYNKYGKFDLSWNGYGNDSIQRRLNCWLDSMNIGTQTMEGLLIIPAMRAMTTDEQLYGNICIKSSGQLIIQSDIEMMGSSCVIVESGGKLVIDGGTLSNVELVLKPSSSLQILNGGTIVTRGGFKAPVGVKVSITDGRIE